MRISGRWSMFSNRRLPRNDICAGAPIKACRQTLPTVVRFFHETIWQGSDVRNSVLSALYIIGPRRWMVVGMLALYLVGAFLELLGIGLIIPFIALMQNPESLNTSQIYKTVVELTGISESRNLLTLLGIAIIFLFVFKGWFRYLVQKNLVRFGWNVQTALREQLLGVYQRQAYTFHMARNSASLINILQGHIGQFVKGFLLASIRLTGEILTLSIMLVFLAYNYLVPTLVVMLLFAGIITLYDRLVRKRVENIGALNARVGADMIKAINQSISGFKEIRIFGVERYFFDRYVNRARAMADASVELTALQILPRFLIESTMVGFIVILALVILWTASAQGAVFTTLGVFAVAGLRILPSASQIIEAIGSLRHAKRYIQEIEGDLRSGQDMLIEHTFAANSPERRATDFQNLIVSNLAYRYPGTNFDVISGIDFTLTRGQNIGIVGPSGAGKTTLVNVILGLLEPTKGDVKVNGRSIDEDIKLWRSKLAYIPQTTLLTDDSLKRNIALGQADDVIDEKKLARAIRLAQLEAVVETLPQGLDTNIAEEGARLSGGQRQRVALARAFYYDRELIVMDEATSALDNVTEREIVEAIESIRGSTTLIVIAHRLSTVRNCDYLIKLEQGRIVSTGSYEEVIEGAAPDRESAV